MYNVIIMLPPYCMIPIEVNNFFIGIMFTPKNVPFYNSSVFSARWGRKELIKKLIKMKDEKQWKYLLK